MRILTIFSFPGVYLSMLIYQNELGHLQLYLGLVLTLIGFLGLGFCYVFP